MKQNKLRMAVHWWGSSEIKYLFMQDRKPVWFRTAAPPRTVLTPPAHTHRVTMGGNWPTGNERNTVRWAKISEQKTTGSYSRSVLTQYETEMAPAVVLWRSSQRQEKVTVAASKVSRFFTIRRISMATLNSLQCFKKGKKNPTNISEKYCTDLHNHLLYSSANQIDF